MELRNRLMIFRIIYVGLITFVILCAKFYFEHLAVGLMIATLIGIITLVVQNISEKRTFDSRNAKFWVFFLLILLIELNFIFFYIYQNAHLSETVWEQIWGFLESSSFKVVVASIVFPIILFLLESIFKFKEKLEDERQKRQFESIKLTQEMWGNITNLIGEIRYYNEKSNKKRTIEEILIELNRFASDMEEVSLTWDFQFSDLEIYEPKYHKLLLAPINLLNNVALTVAQFIYENTDEKNEIEDYQLALGAIAIHIEFDFHDMIFNIFECYMKIEKEQSADKKEIHKKELKDNLKLLEELSLKLKKLELKYNNAIWFLETDKNQSNNTKQIKYIFDKIKKWCEDYPDENIGKCPMIEDLKALYNQKVKLNNLKYFSTQIPFSKRFMIELARSLDFEMLCEDLKYNLDIIQEQRKINNQI